MGCNCNGGTSEKYNVVLADNSKLGPFTTQQEAKVMQARNPGSSIHKVTTS